MLYVNDNNRLIQIVRNLASDEAERDFVEFKENNSDPATIAKNISGISNALTRLGFSRGYIIWGISDDGSSQHSVVGTSFSPMKKKVGGEELELWLSKLIKPDPMIRFEKIVIDGENVIVMVIENNPTEVSKYKNVAYIRIGANTRKLDDFPEIEKEVWRKVTSKDFETAPAKSGLFRKDIEMLLDFEAFYELRRHNGFPIEKDAVFDELIRCEMVKNNGDSTYDITNLGALLLARRFSNFPSISYKVPRVIVYDGDSKIITISDQPGAKGYAVGFADLHTYIMQRVKKGEILENGIRKNLYLYPEIAVRELLANAIVHQDFSIEGMQPVVEIFSNRIEFTNPGQPIVDKMRFVDSSAARNRRLADELSKLGICERRGSGWDKIAGEIDDNRFPAPEIESLKDATRVILSQSRPINDMTKEQQLWSVYIHTCLLWAKRSYMNNTTVRQRFDIEDKNMSVASRLIAQAVEKELVAVFDEESGTKNRKYMPFWVKAQTR